MSITNRLFLGLILLLVIVASCTSNKKPSTDLKLWVPGSIDIIDKIRFTDVQKQLTMQYCKDNYDLNDYILRNPKMIVIHYTAVPDLKETLEIFQKDSLSSNRSYIAGFSPLNVGIHYIIDKDGKIYQTKPDSVIARHIIGYNHVALGIENVALNESELTANQVESNCNLIYHLYSKYNTIEYLIGHHEYDNPKLSHYTLIKILNKDYRPYTKYDPGNKFMEQVRTRLKRKYGIEFKK